MPRRTDISSILITGAGPIVIGRAARSDLSGLQESLYLFERFVGMMRG